MRRGMLFLLSTVLCGCQGETPEVQTVRTVPTIKRTVVKHPLKAGTGTFVVDIITINRSAYHKLAQLKSTMETAGVYGPDEKLLAMNGLMMGRTDMRFAAQFNKAVDAMRSDPKRMTVVRLIADGRSQNFDVGDTLHETTVFVCPEADAVTGRHYRRARYRMLLNLESVQQTPKTAEIKTSWQLRTGPGLSRTVSIAPLDVTAELVVGQSLIVAPADFRGRGVGRAFLSGVDEKAVELTFFVITPKELHAKGELQ